MSIYSGIFYFYCFLFISDFPSLFFGIFPFGLNKLCQNLLKAFLLVKNYLTFISRGYFSWIFNSCDGPFPLAFWVISLPPFWVQNSWWAFSVFHITFPLFTKHCFALVVSHVSYSVVCFWCVWLCVAQILFSCVFVFA